MRLTILLIMMFVLPVIAHDSYAKMDTLSNTITNNYSTAQLLLDRDAVVAGEPFWLALHLDMEDEWHTYWRNPGDSGLPTSITLDMPQGFGASEIYWPAPIRFEMAGIINYGYRDDAYHFVKITPPDVITDDMVTLHVKTSWLICKDICVPEYADFVLNIPVAQTSNVYTAFSQLQEALPDETLQARFTKNDNLFFLTLPFENNAALEKPDASEYHFFPVTNNILSNEQPISILRTGKAVEVRATSGPQSSDTLHGVLVDKTHSKVYNVEAVQDATLQLAQPQSPATSVSLSLVTALVFAFVGGLILNLMPCVLPILSLKLLNLVQHAQQSRKTSLKHGLAYTAGVMGCFAIIAVILLIVQQGGAHIGWGFQLQSPAFVATLALLMLLVGLNLSGVYELPILFGSVGQKASSGTSVKGSFFTGTLAVLVATPCTAPLMAPSIGYALSQPPAILIIIFLMLGAGLATPFLLVSALPHVARYMPKSGMWMLRFKQFLAFPMYATAAWLAWVLTRQSGTDGLVLLLAGGVVLSWLVWWAAGTANRGVRWIIIIASGVVVFSTISGVNTLNKDDNTAYRLDSIAQAYTPQTLQGLLKDGVPVFVYATADWCITCKVNERLVLNTTEVLTMFKQHKVVVLKADWTHYDEAITDFLRSHDRAGVPLYVYYSPSGEADILPQILTTGRLLEAITH